jgi:cytochrome c biogenesis protein CcdA/thiol-disulfide isomerase/thioredoxin
MLILIPVAFLVGFVTSCTPCVLPVLPVILAGGGTAATKRKPYAIVAGLITTFVLFTLAGTWIWSELHIRAKYQIDIGAAVLLFVALTLVVPIIGTWIERPLAFLTRRRVGDLGGGFVLGASLGLVFVPCAGPLLSVLIVNAGTHRVGALTVFTLLAFGVGAAIPMLLIARGTRRTALSLRAHAQEFRVAAGVLMAIAAVVIYKGWLTSLQTKVPGYALAVERALEHGSVKKEINKLAGHTNGPPSFAKAGGHQLASRPIKVPLTNFGAAPDFGGISRWLNTPGGRPLSLPALRGHVVLVDFWTYSCINCLRTLPHLKAWYARYHSKGLEIVGVHTPEFGFEHDYGNVRAAVSRLGVRYPVALDNKYATWNAYQNQYWPAEYLIDEHGDVRHVNFGEGDYGTTEQDIRLLLRAGGDSSLPAAKTMPDLTPRTALTPETYLGTFRLQRYSGSTIVPNTAHRYSFPRSLPADHLAYAGNWTVESERILAGEGARLRLNFHAEDVYIVLGGHGTVHASVDGKPAGSFAVGADKLYTVLSGNTQRTGILELAFTPGVKAYSFTFG